MNDKQPDNFDFSSLMAATVHDMKNVMSVIQQAYTTWLADLPEEYRERAERSLIEKETLHLQSMTVQLLGLYKLEKSQLAFTPGYHLLDEFFEDQISRHAEVIATRGLEIDFQLDDPDLEGYFDCNLLEVALDNAIGNAQRFANSQIQLTARREAGGTLLQVSDDGPGYPAHMLGELSTDASSISLGSGSTGLGLYFTRQIARLHDNEQAARVSLSNGAPLVGGNLSIWLP
ncbi:MAG: sensor histidine kinase [Pseudomonadaceae bacterium]|nr:MAG: sensor histidine kinase [Pseudomonadaceae bacterium]